MQPLRQTLYNGTPLILLGGWGSANVSVTVRKDGDYLCIFESGFEGGNTSAQIEIGLGVNTTVAATAGTIRGMRGGIQQIGVTTHILALTAGDVVNGIAQKVDGGTTTLLERRISIVRVH